MERKLFVTANILFGDKAKFLLIQLSRFQVT